MSSQTIVNEGVSYKTIEKGLYTALQSPSLVYNLIGYSGIGKTAIVRDVVDQLGGEVTEINSSLLQAGDLAMPVKHEDEENNPIVKYIVNEIVTGVNNKAKQDPDNIYVIFFDEFNRADAEVQSDLMNLILQRQLFDVVLEDNVRVVSAQNPDVTTEGFEHTEYDVNEVDGATASRVVDIRMRFATPDWLSFGTQYDEEKQRHNVHPMVTSFIVNGNEEQLLMFNPDKRNNPSPRSWTLVGDLLYDFGVEDFEGVDDDIINFIEEAILGLVGGDSARAFISFAETFTSYIQDKEWIESTDEEFETLLERYKGYDNTKQVIMVEDLIKYMLKNNELVESEKHRNRIARVLAEAPMDTITNQLRTISQKFNEIYKNQQVEQELHDEKTGTKRVERMSKGMVMYIKFVNSYPPLVDKQRESINNSRVKTAQEL